MVKDDMKVKKEIDPANNYIPEQHAPQKKTLFPGKPNLILNWEKRKSRKLNNQEKQGDIMAIIRKLAFLVSASVRIYSHTLCPNGCLLYTGRQPNLIDKVFG